MDADDWLNGAHPLDMLEEALSIATPKRMRLFAAEVCRAIGQEEACRQLIAWAEGHAAADALDQVRQQNWPWRPSGPRYNPRRVPRQSQVLNIVTAAATNDDRNAAWGAAAAAFPMLQQDLIPLIQCLFADPVRPVAFDPAWRTSTAVELARQMYESRGFANMPILADSLQDAGCANEDVLTHCRGPGPHVRGCWVVDLVLGKS
jgi:hypothetical protein